MDVMLSRPLLFREYIQPPCDGINNAKLKVLEA